MPPCAGNWLQLRGSRAAFGYLGVFGTFVPVWFSGDEFNNEPTQLPATSTRLYYTGTCCSVTQLRNGSGGGWSYGTHLPTPLRASIAANATRAAMLADVSAMFAIFNAGENAALLSRDQCSSSRILRIANFTVTNESAPTELNARPGNGQQLTSSNIWVPYARWSATHPGRAIVVAANPSRSSPLPLELDIPLEAMGMGDARSLEVTTLYPTTVDAKPVLGTPGQLAAWPVVVAADGVRNGGLVVLSLEAIDITAMK